MKRTINDWKPEVSSLFERLLKNGIKLSGVDNGEDYTEYGAVTAEKFLEEAIACDEFTLYVRLPNGSVNWLWCVLGNSPGELVADYSIPKDEADAKLLDNLTGEHYNEWESKPQPKSVVDY